MLDQIAQYAQQLAGQYADWANGVFSQTSNVTNRAVENFFDTSTKMSNFAQGLTDQYNNVFAPENAQLIQDANTYASTPRLQANMGMAGATQAQAGDQAIKNSEADLLSYGIDPSSGRYAALDKAAAVQNAANVAGAENTQRNADIATGQKLRSEAVQVGAQLPGAVTNASNTAIQANTGASNASLANANTGANLMSLADKYLQTAMGLKLPLMGQNTRSSGQSSQNSQSSNPNGGGGGGGGNGAGSGGSGGGGPAWMGTHGGAGAGGIFSIPNTNDYNYSDPTAGTDWSQWTDPSANTGTGYIGDQSNPSTDYVGSNPFSDTGFGQTYDYGGNTSSYTGADMNSSSGGGWGDTSGLGAYNYDPSANAPTTDMSGWGDYSTPSSDTNWGDTSGFAGGGAVPDSASPSGGQQIDDIPTQMPGGAPARLNAGEFVLPQDVARWKGQEFFHKLIAQSRSNMAQMQAHTGAQPKPMARR
jgi:hypothetical protein